MNTNDNRDTSTDKTAFRFARRAAVMALPLGLLAATAAGPVQAAHTDPAPLDPAAVPVPASVPVNVPIASEGAEFTIKNWEAKGKTKSKTYGTGPLEGQATLAETPEGASATDLILFNPVGEEGDLGQVRVTSVDPETPDADAAKQYVVAFEVEALPGHQRPVTLQTAPFEIKAVAEATDVTAFPPVNQLYQLQEPVKLYEQEDGQAATKSIGELESFDVIVNHSDDPAVR
ncbi:hypothetical protein O1R50_08215 [Glycomyces luteolus]|uniref:Uncharacterized protein n=1 Tax=Glycomyces luteolus TaxID=2670330 RepID=A0A9X3P9W4_9ACTN|nr:hypothetical protein [Glycomyces luteolus]MDA1359603.1 hypothetical protein [Glycomyces luteolus]